MKITLAEVKSLEASLAKIFDKELKIQVAYRLSRLLKRLTTEMEALEENRIKLVKKYGIVNEENKQLTVPQDKTQDFYREFSELMSLEIDIPFEPIALESFGDISLSAADVAKLDGKIIANDDDDDDDDDDEEEEVVDAVEEKKPTVI
jgi:hypothetical protein